MVNRDFFNTSKSSGISCRPSKAGPCKQSGPILKSQTYNDHFVDGGNNLARK